MLLVLAVHNVELGAQVALHLACDECIFTEECYVFHIKLRFMKLCIILIVYNHGPCDSVNLYIHHTVMCPGFEEWWLYKWV